MALLSKDRPLDRNTDGAKALVVYRELAYKIDRETRKRVDVETFRARVLGKNEANYCYRNLVENRRVQGVALYRLDFSPDGLPIIGEDITPTRQSSQ